MDIVRNKAIAKDFFHRFSAGDIDGAVALLDENATWWLPGHPDEIPFAGLYTREAIAALFDRMIARLKDGLKMEVRSAVAEDDAVALEVVSRGELTNGRIYTNEYHALMRIKNGKIIQVREYNDTAHAHAVWARA